MKLTPAGVLSAVHTFRNFLVISMIGDSAGNLFYMYRSPVESGYVFGELTPSGVEVPYCGAPAPSVQTVLTGDCSSTYINYPSGAGMDFDASGNVVFNQETEAGDAQTSALFKISAVVSEWSSLFAILRKVGRQGSRSILTSSL